ncbi:hypothetical protein CUJ89_35915 [Burkholderia pyrrocinia]|uniref:Awr type III effector family protein n=1 Tax=Burkholderia pyrrocinia TaxID=60550 RepID=A0A2Z5N872_BURPY|nr:hypothetical protein CUJ89_35915 [Burkholderia pyrrocinia]
MQSAHPAPTDHSADAAQQQPAATDSSATPQPRRTLGELLGGNPGAPTEAAPRRPNGGTGNFASKLKGRAQRFMQKRLVSTTTSAVVVSSTHTGRPTALPARGNTRIESHPDSPALDTPAPDTPPPPLPSSQERRLARVMKQTFDAAASPGAAVRDDIKHALGMKPVHDTARLDAMGSGAGFEQWLGTRFGDTPAAHALHAALAQPFAGHDMRVPDALPFAPHALLADALAQATHAQPARAHAALTALQRGAFLPSASLDDDPDADVFHDALDRLDDSDDAFEDAIGDTAPFDAPLPTSPASPQARADAFAVAQILADSGAGFDALAALLPPLSAPRRDALRDVLSASAQIAAERGEAADLAGTLQHATQAAGQPARDTLACKALRASHARLAGDAPLSAADRTALFAWRQGFRDDGRHGMLSRTRERLAKFRKYVSRAESRDRMNRTAFDPAQPLASSLRVTGNAVRRAKHVVQRAFGTKKSPLLAAGRYGTMGAHLKHPDDDQARLDTHLTQAIDLLRAHLEEAHPLQPTDAADVLAGRTPAALARIAVLAHWAERSETARPYGQSLDAQSLVDIAARIDALAGVPPRFSVSPAAAERPHAMPPLPPAVAALAGMKLTDDTLAAWAAQSALPMQQAGESGAPPAESAFAGALRHARAILHPLDVKPDNLSPDALKTFLKQYIADHNGGNTLSFTDGGVAGADAGALSINIALAVTHAGALLLPIIDVGASRGRTATVSIATGSEGGEIFIGTQSAHEGHVGGGVFLGAGYGVKHAKHFNALVGGAASATGRVEHAKPTGVRLRFVPPKNADGKPDYAAMRTKMSEAVDYLFEMSAPEQRDLSANDLWEHFANRYFDDRELSVAWVDHRQATARMGTSVTGIARIGGKSKGGQTARVGGSLTYGAQWAATLAKRDDATGAHPQMRRSEGTSHLQTLTASANMTVPSVDLPGEGAADTPNSLSFPSIPFASATFALHESGFDAAFNAMLEQGRFSESNTFIDLTEHNAGSFARFASEPGHREQWERVCTALEDGDAERGRARLDKLLDDATRGERPNQGFYIRYRLKQDVLRTLDQYAAAAKQAARRPDGADELAALRRASYALVRRPDARVPQSLAVYEEVSARRSAGVNFGLQVQAQTSASGAREVSLIDLPLDIANRWAQPAPADANAG